MPRPKITEDRRRRVAKACIPCREGKQKCDGLTPCAQCTERNRISCCTYSSIERSYGRSRRRRITMRNRERQSSPLEVSTSPNRPSVQGQSPTPQECRSTLHQPNTKSLNILRKSQTLYDTRGRIEVYLGECAAPAFLRQLQELLESDPSPATDRSAFSKLTAIEELPLPENEANQSGDPGYFSDLQDLVDVFFTSSCGILDIVDRQHVNTLLENWRNGALVDTASISVLFLVLAYAAQARSASMADTQRMQYYYRRGRQIALLELTDEPQLETVQAFILISLFMLGCSQRNGSFMNLGFAISAAKALGFHRDDINDAFPERNSQLRARIWRSLRYHDLFFCAMMGRTPLTMTTDYYYSDEHAKQISSCDNDRGQQLALFEGTRAFGILERIVAEIYTKNSASLAQLETLAHDLQAATTRIPSKLRTVTSNEDLAQIEVIRNAHVACSYYFSMMLLTRPFLIAVIRRQHNLTEDTSIVNTQPSHSEDPKLDANITHGALTSIDSALHTIQLLHDTLAAKMLFNNMVLVVAWVFVASLTICSAHVGRLGNSSVNEQAIKQAEEILKYFSKHTRQGKRYGNILKKLYASAKDYVKALEARERRARKIRMPELFSLNNAGPGRIARDIPGLSGQQSIPIQQSHEVGVGIPQPEVGVSYVEADNSPHVNQRLAEALLWDPSEQDNQWLTMNYASITDIIDSFAEMGAVSTADSLPDGDTQDHFHSAASQTDYAWDINWGEP